jgi:hypothetical protein
MGSLITFYMRWERKRLFGATVEENWEPGGPRFINKACIPNKRLLRTSGVMQVQSKVRHSTFSQMEEWCPQNINKSLWFSGLGVGLSPCSHRFNPCCINILFELFCVMLCVFCVVVCFCVFLLWICFAPIHSLLIQTKDAWRAYDVKKNRNAAVNADQPMIFLFCFSADGSSLFL